MYEDLDIEPIKTEILEASVAASDRTTKGIHEEGMAVVLYPEAGSELWQ